MKKERALEILKNALYIMELHEYEHGAILDYLQITQKEYEEIKRV